MMSCRRIVFNWFLLFEVKREGSQENCFKNCKKVRLVSFPSISLLLNRVLLEWRKDHLGEMGWGGL